MSLRVLISATVSYVTAAALVLAVVFGSVLALLLATPLFIYMAFRVLKLEKQAAFFSNTYEHES